MKRIALSLSLVAASMLMGVMTSCGPRPTTKIDSPVVHDVAWTTLTQDFHTAQNYKDRLVRIRLEPGEYSLSPTRLEIHVHAIHKLTQPLLICRYSSWPGTAQSVTVVGRCRGPEKDGLWRSPRHDFAVIVDDCVVSAR